MFVQHQVISHSVFERVGFVRVCARACVCAGGHLHVCVDAFVMNQCMLGWTIVRVIKNYDLTFWNLSHEDYSRTSVFRDHLLRGHLSVKTIIYVATTCSSL